jgi:DNA-binding NarL/FixJ family response regulator
VQTWQRAPRRLRAVVAAEASTMAQPGRKPVRILIADDHDVVREGLRALLGSNPDWLVCGEAVTGREAIDLVRAQQPDIVVLDVSMPDLNGIEAARQIRRIAPRTEVLILTMHDSERLFGEALDIGVCGYVLKADAGRELVAAVAALARHRPFFSSGVTKTLVDGYRGQVRAASGATPSAVRLTARERQVIQLIAEGKSNKEVATVLAIAVKTVAAHRANVFQKLDIHSVAQLVRYAVRNNIVEP